MEATEVMELISIDLFKRMVNDLEAKLNNSSKLNMVTRTSQAGRHKKRPDNRPL